MADGGVLFSSDAADDILDAVAYVDSLSRTRKAARGRGAGSGVPAVVVARVTSATPDANGYYPAVVTVYNVAAATWTDLAAVYVVPLNGEALANNRRYGVKPAGPYTSPLAPASPTLAYQAVSAPPEMAVVTNTCIRPAGSGAGFNGLGFNIVVQYQFPDGETWCIINPTGCCPSGSGSGSGGASRCCQATPPPNSLCLNAVSHGGSYNLTGTYTITEQDVNGWITPNPSGGNNGWLTVGGRQFQWSLFCLGGVWYIGLQEVFPNGDPTQIGLSVATVTCSPFVATAAVLNTATGVVTYDDGSTGTILVRISSPTDCGPPGGGGGGGMVMNNCCVTGMPETIHATFSGALSFLGTAALNSLSNTSPNAVWTTNGQTLPNGCGNTGWYVQLVCNNDNTFTLSVYQSGGGGLLVAQASATGPYFHCSPFSISSLPALTLANTASCNGQQAQVTLTT